MPLTPEQRAKLPKYASREIERLERQVEHLEGLLAVGPEDSDTFVDDYGVNPDRPLGKGPMIRFGKDSEVALTGRFRKGVLQVSNSGWGRLTVNPVASNVIEVEIRSR